MIDLWTRARSPRWVITLLNEDDQPLGELTGVRGGYVEIVTLARLGGSAQLNLTKEARREIDFFTDRVLIEYDPGVNGLDPIPWGVYLFSSPKVAYGDVVQEELGLLSKMAVIDEDSLLESYSLPAGTPVIDTVRQLISSAGESRVAVTDSGAETSNALVWEAGESKLSVINDLLTSAGYRSLWCDGSGQFRVEPYVEPGALSVARTFEPGAASIHKPAWTREQNLTGIPNRVIVVCPGTDEEPPIVGVAENNDVESPFSIPRRGRVITRREEVSDVEDAAVAQSLAERYLFNSMSTVAHLSVKHAIVPLDPGQRVRFTSRGETRDATVQRMRMGLDFKAQCDAEWREI